MPRQILRDSFLACVFVCCTASAQSPNAVSPAIALRLKEIIAHVRDDGLPGGIIVRVQSVKDNRVWEGAAGPFDEAKEVPVQPNDPFRVASITKSFTAAVIWRLAERGKIGIDDLISRYIEPSIIARIHVLNGVSSGERITIRQLLCHCSGIYDYAADNNWNRLVYAHPEKHWEPKELIEVAIGSGEPYFAPGEGYHYSDTGYLLLGLIIEKVTGKPLATVYREYVYTPLGLTDTYLEGRESAIGRPRSHNYVGYLDDTNYDPTSDAYASGGQVSTTTDLALFITGVLQGRFFKDPKTLAATLAVAEVPEIPHDPVRESRKHRAQFMFNSEERGGVEFIGHAGVWGAAMFYQPERQLVITGTSNQEERRLPLADIAKAFDVSTASAR